MDDINQILFNLDPRSGIIVGVMVGFLVFAVSLDLTWEKMLRALRKPKAPGIGLDSQFGILPAIVYWAGQCHTTHSRHRLCGENISISYPGTGTVTVTASRRRGTDVAKNGVLH